MPPRVHEVLLGALDDLPGESAPSSVNDGGDAAGAAARLRDAAVLAALDRARRRGPDGEGDVLLLADAYPRLLQWEPWRDPDGGWVLRRSGNGERRSRGAFATPAPLAVALAESACGPALAAGRVPTVVDPACGAGALLRAALARLLAAGVAPATAAAALHGVDLDPVAVALTRSALGVDLRRAGLPEGAEAGPRILAGDALLGPVPAVPAPDVPGLVWHRVFPDVLDRADLEAEPVTGWRGGFDAVVANPPWERWKVHARDWVGDAPAGLRAARAAAAAHVRGAGRHPLTGRGEVNAYLPFLETCWRLLAADGRASVLVPAGVASDRSASALMVELVESGSLERLRLLGEREAGFLDVSARVPIAVVDLRCGVPRAGRPSAAAPAHVVGPGVEGGWPLDAELMRLVSPNVATIPLCATPDEHDLLVRTHRARPVLLRREPEGRADGGGWGVRFVTPLHMSRDARHFRCAPGPGLVPLWEAKQAGLLDHRGGRSPGPRYWVPEGLLAQRHPQLWERGWLLGYRNVSVADGARTLLPCALPPVAVGNSLPLVDSREPELLLAVLAALPTDFLLRAKHAGANLNFFKIEQVAVPQPEHFRVRGPGGATLCEHVWGLLGRAVAWHADGPHALARRLGVDAELQGGADDDERARARAGIDAAVAWALGWSRADLATALRSFRRLAAQEEAACGEFRSARLASEAYDALALELGEPPGRH